MKTRTAIVRGVTAAGRALAVAVLISAGMAHGAGEAPSNSQPPKAQELEGSYYQGDGPAYNLDLTLKPGGEYTAKWHSCLYAPGEASGKWRLEGDRITFSPALEGAMLKPRLDSLVVRKHADEWVLVNTGKQNQETGAQQTLSTSAALRRIDTPARWAGLWQAENGAMGEFHTLELREEGDFSWYFRDQPLRAEDTYTGKWHIEDGALHLQFVNGRTELGQTIIPKRPRLVLSMSHDRESLIQADQSGFRLERSKQKSARKQD